MVPFSWQDVREINVRGVNVRDVVERVELSASYDLRFGVYRPDYGPSSPWSCTPYSVREGNAAFGATLQFLIPDALAWLKANLASETASELEIEIRNRNGQRLSILGASGERGLVARNAATHSAFSSRLPLVLKGLTFDFHVPPSPDPGNQLPVLHDTI